MASKMGEKPECERNLTFQILQHASRNGYAVGAFNCYNDDGVMAVIRAAESQQSPAIIQLFPWTMHFQGPHFIRYVVAAAHTASVPIAVHLDHCVTQQDIDLALTLPFDSIMIDASTLEEEENVATCAKNIRKARERGMTVEVEMGRIEGGEDGLMNVDAGTIFTTPTKAERFISGTGAHFLAPSFGNVHGAYGPGGAERAWNLGLLKSIHHAVPHIPLVLHGTHPVSDGLFLKAIECGVAKININRNARDDYTAFVAANAGKLQLTKLKEEGVKIYTQSVERIMRLFRSSGMGSKYPGRDAL